MNDILNKSTVLVLNRHWQATHVKTPAEAFCMLATGAATTLNVQADDYITPVRWDDWLKLPGRKLSSKEGNIDHVVPRSRGCKTSWDNCVLAHREVNSRKADRPPA